MVSRNREVKVCSELFDVLCIIQMIRACITLLESILLEASCVVPYSIWLSLQI